MSSKTRSVLLLVGSAIALFSYWFPGLYGIAYAPPPGSPATKVALKQLPSFSGDFVSAHSGVYSGFSGPADLHASLDALIGMAILGVVSLLIKDVDAASEKLGKVKKIKDLSRIGSIGSGTLAAAILIWSFRFNMVPPDVHTTFVRALGGGPTALRDATYLSGQLGLGSLILLFGLLIGYTGTRPKLGCALVCLLVGGFFVGLVYTKITTGVW